MTSAVKFKSIVRSDHTVQLPAEVPEGPVEIIVLVETEEDNQAREARGEQRRRAMGGAAGLFTVADDFDDPLPAEVLREFEGTDPVAR